MKRKKNRNGADVEGSINNGLWSWKITKSTKLIEWPENTKLQELAKKLFCFTNDCVYGKLCALIYRFCFTSDWVYRKQCTLIYHTCHLWPLYTPKPKKKVSCIHFLCTHLQTQQQWDTLCMNSCCLNSLICNFQHSILKRRSIKIHIYPQPKSARLSFLPHYKIHPIPKFLGAQHAFKWKFQIFYENEAWVNDQNKPFCLSLQSLFSPPEQKS